MPKKLLITDDALIIRQQIKDAATSVGWHVAGEAGNGQEAIDRYSELKPDACTLDLAMPEYDGLHALRGIMRMDPKANVLVVSAMGQKSMVKKALKLGACDFLIKPVSRRTLVSTLGRLAYEMPEAESV